MVRPVPTTDSTSNNWQPLARFDLGKLDCRVVPGVSNDVRVAVQAERISVWFNRMQPSSDPTNGLRADIGDKDAPILAGGTGVRAHGVDAWFDNIVVIPADMVGQ